LHFLSIQGALARRACTNSPQMEISEMATNTIKLHRVLRASPDRIYKGMDHRLGLQQMAAAERLPGRGT